MNTPAPAAPRPACAAPPPAPSRAPDGASDAAPSPARVVLVTGAGRRLGRAIALALAQAGWHVAVHYHQSRQAADDTAAACAALAGDGAAFGANLADEAAVRALLPRVAARLGRVDAVVNSAALFEFDDAARFGLPLLDAHLRVNTAAPVLLAQALAQHLAARAAQGDAAQGCVVNLLDQKLWNPNPDFLSYTLSKAALQSATTLLAQALAPRLRVVGVAPGLTLSSHLMASEEQFQRLHAQSPLGKSSTPDDVAAAVAFALASPAITGATLLVDGGQHLMRFERDFSMMPAAAPPDDAQKTGSSHSQQGIGATLLQAPASHANAGAQAAASAVKSTAPNTVQSAAANAGDSAPKSPAPCASGQRTLALTGLRFNASLGILAHEKNAPQPIQVDAELNLGAQPLRPRDDDITHVLDYRKVRQIIIDECTAEHVNLLESLIGKLCQRLLTLPGVRGVRVKIAKLQIFSDCEVAMRMETGQW